MQQSFSFWQNYRVKTNCSWMAFIQHLCCHLGSYISKVQCWSLKFKIVLLIWLHHTNRDKTNLILPSLLGCVENLKNTKSNYGYLYFIAPWYIETEKTWFFEFQDFSKPIFALKPWDWAGRFEYHEPYNRNDFFSHYKGVKEIFRSSPPKLKNVKIKKIMFFLFLYTMEP